MGNDKGMLRCRKCGNEMDAAALKKKKYVCPCCGYYFRMPAKARMELLVDKGSFEEWLGGLETADDMGMPGYKEKLKKAQEATGLKEAVLTGKGCIYGEPICLCICDAGFLMGSMGRVVGEKITAAVERATQEQLPIFIFCCSGGARMQEGILSLMQMEKTAAAIGRHAKAGLFYASVLTDPTTGGVAASFAMLGDVIMAEPEALIGFAGQRVIRQTIGKELPEGFQTAEFQEKHGMIDGIVERRRLKQVMQFFILTNRRQEGYANFRGNIKKEFMISAKGRVQNLFCAKKTAWERVKAVRGVKHPSSMDYILRIFDIFIELKGDRLYADDGAVVGGIALLDGQPITVITEYRGKEIQECMERNFGMPMPEGYRKALRLMKQAEKFNRPVITFVNTPGAYCGVGAEERGQGAAIAQNLLEMSLLKVPVLVVIVGEAGSGGALAVAVGNEVWMFENATYSVLTPEGYAAILWKDASRADEAAEQMHMLSQDMKRLRIIDKVIPEFGGASQDNVEAAASYLKGQIKEFLQKMSSKSAEELCEERYQRFRRM